MSQCVSLMSIGTISAHVEIDVSVIFFGGGGGCVAARFCMDRSGIGASFHCIYNKLRVSPSYGTWTLLPAMELWDVK